jgi:Zincin-like metallopeptidase
VTLSGIEPTDGQQPPDGGAYGVSPERGVDPLVGDYVVGHQGLDAVTEPTSDFAQGNTGGEPHGGAGVATVVGLERPVANRFTCSLERAVPVRLGRPPAELGISHATRDDHAAYLAHWVRILRQDPRHLWTVAGDAETAADYLLNLGAEP